MSSFPSFFSEVNSGEISRVDTALGSTCLTDVLTGKKDFDPEVTPLSVTTPEMDFPGGSDGKAPVYNVRDLGSIPGLGRSLEKEMATHSSTLALKIPWTEEPGRLQSIRL